MTLSKPLVEKLDTAIGDLARNGIRQSRVFRKYNWRSSQGCERGTNFEDTGRHKLVTFPGRRLSPPIGHE